MLGEASPLARFDKATLCAVPRLFTMSLFTNERAGRPATSREAGNDVEEVEHLVPVHDGHLSLAHSAADGAEEVAGVVCPAAVFLPLGPGWRALEDLRVGHDAVLYEHGTVLGVVDLVPLTVQAEHTHAGGAIKDGVACREGPYVLRRIWLAGRRSVGEHADSPLFVHPLLVFVVHFWVIQ